MGLACVALLLVVGCSGGTESVGGSNTETSASVVPMGGPAVEVKVTREALENMPEPWVLNTPEAAVRSYLAWTSYAYRIAQSDVATPTMTPYEEVRVDAYIQYNIQKKRLIDQTLDSIVFGKPSVGATSTLLPVKESWTYRYISVETAGKVVGGPYSASYDSTYTVVKSDTGAWRVDSVKAKALGEVK